MGIFGGRKPARPISFEDWRGRLPQNLQNSDDYDLRGAWAGNVAPAPNGHLPDTYKLPNHMTFSDESQYSTPEHTGGQWRQDGNGRWVFWASPYNMNTQGAATIAEYFRQREPDSTLVLPIDYRLPSR